MSKIAILTDLHFGSRNNDMNVLKNQEEFFEKVFFPYMTKNKIKTLIDLGDTFDRRKVVDINILKETKHFFFDKLKELNVTTHILVGNHSCYFTNTNEINNIDTNLAEYSNIFVYKGPQHIDIDGFKPLIIPWINKENYQETMDIIKKSKAMFVFGHLEITGFEFHAGSVCKHGISPTIFKKFAKVYSGHFHKKSENGVISYLGSPYQTTWIEFTERKGFHIFDTETHEMEFIENPHRLFVEVDETYDFKTPIKGKYVRLVVTEENSKLPEYDILKAKLENEGCIKVAPKIIDKVSITETVEVDDEKIDNMDIISISNDYIDKLEYSKKEELKDLMMMLYRAANA